MAFVSTKSIINRRNFAQNLRDAAQATVRALRDYSNPLSLVRLARLHGTGHEMRESLLASDQWHEAHSELSKWTEPPELELDA